MSRESWIALNLISRIEGRIFTVLIEHFDSPSNILEASRTELLKVPGIGPEEADAILSIREGSRLEEELTAIEKNKVSLITLEDESYPALLKEIETAPPVLYIKGTLPAEFFGVAVVGTRKPSSYGILMAERLVSDMVPAGVAIISGMARGIDTAAHKTAIKEGGFTAAVLGCGVDRIYPPENKKLYNEIAEKGAVVSEFPMGTIPHKANFPRRNRIISGMSKAVLVIEAGERSGTLITARFALEQGRDVFAVPGKATSPESRGTNDLIKKGARLVADFNDLCDELGLDRGFLNDMKNSRNGKESSGIIPDELGIDETRLLEFLGNEPLHIDNIVRTSGFPAGKTSSILMKLEIGGFVRQLTGKMFARR